MKHVFTIVLFYFFAAATAFDPAADFCHENGGVCLSSFIWCNNQSPTRCTWPDGIDPLVRDSSPYGVVYRDNTYNITWTNALIDRPVIVEWWSEARGVEGLRMLWSAEEEPTSSAVKFNPEAILDALSSSNTTMNATMEQIIYGTEGVGNFIKIRQPDTDHPTATSQQFAVFGEWTAAFAENMREGFKDDMAATERRWKLGVGIGVGIGVPALMGLTWFLASRERKTTVAKSAS